MRVDRAAAKRILDNLEFVGIIERRNPMVGAPMKPVYRIKDPFIAFYYSLLSGRMRLIESSSNSDKVYNIIENDVKSHLEHMFEVLCGEWLDTHYPVLQRGQWWRMSNGEFVDIDIVAKMPDERKIIHTIVGECKFSKKPMGFGPLNTLVSRMKDAGIDENIGVMLFSASGFEEELSEYAEDNGIILIDGDILMNDKPSPMLFH